MKSKAFFILMFIAAAMPVAATTSLSQADSAYNAGNFRQAIKLFHKAAGEGETPALCYYNMANAYFQLDSLAEAVVYYRACIQNAPDFFKANFNLAVCYYQLNDLGRCLASIKRTLELDPTHQKALLIQAATLRRVGAVAKAVAAFENIIRLYPQVEEAYIALGEMYRDIGDADEAIKWLESFPLNGKNTLYVDLLLADLYEKARDVSRSISYLAMAFNLDTTKQWTLHRIAQLQLQFGNQLVALETCRDGMRRFPNFADMAVLAGSIAFDRQRIDEAEQFFSLGAKNGSPSAVVGLTNVHNWRKAHMPQ
ncbi:MAG TPA: tetratricopeptide repeat protein [Chitinivibrionales bacterium]|jgi:tetratricopeptide (TPR) repeat protein|nr:tetratricopeptide repeat protein [Chitinivibrionales bacterium]